ncbi:DUF1801 domain-containing protein [Salibacterium aidingense]|uniref:DUF1801 domain-containing protein n=1 Tax=Salibacterium aidingense TaxID=384933 RepID=UPI0004109B74|nr:DUF1801 domain-containing protein [Salibacterium aidingense]
MDNLNQYMGTMDSKWKEAFVQLKEVVDENIPVGFEPAIQYGMPSYVVPLCLYPAEYHAKKDIPLPLISLAAQKRHIALYHMGLYADPALLEWFEKGYAEHAAHALNMGKSCIRFTKPDQIPYPLIGELVSKMSVEEWIALYENSVKG